MFINVLWSMGGWIVIKKKPHLNVYDFLKPSHIHFYRSSCAATHKGRTFLCISSNTVYWNPSVWADQAVSLISPMSETSSCPVCLSSAWLETNVHEPLLRRKPCNLTEVSWDHWVWIVRMKSCLIGYLRKSNMPVNGQGGKGHVTRTTS